MKHIPSIFLVITLSLSACVMPATSPSDQATQTAVTPHPSSATPEALLDTYGTPEATAIAADCDYKATFLGDITVPDSATLLPGQEFVKTWQMRNAGTCDWTEGITIVHVDGVLLADEESFSVPPAKPLDVVEIALPMRAPTEPGTYRSYWRLADASGKGFGPAVYAVIVVREVTPTPMPTEPPPTSTPTPTSVTPTAAPALVPTTTRTPCRLNAAFIADVTIPDDTVMRPAEVFEKVWRIKNNGACEWPAGAALNHVEGTKMITSANRLLEPVAVGQVTEVSVTMRAPTQPGRYVEHLRLCDEGGACFGMPVYARIVVRKGNLFGPAKEMGRR